MRKNVFGRPAGEVKPRPIGQKAETRRGQISTAFARKHRIQLFLQGMQVQDVGRRI